jgi:hypothetical protein
MCQLRFDGLVRCLLANFTSISLSAISVPSLFYLFRSLLPPFGKLSCAYVSKRAKIRPDEVHTHLPNLLRRCRWERLIRLPISHEYVNNQEVRDDFSPIHILSSPIRSRSLDHAPDELPTPYWNVSNSHHGIRIHRFILFSSQSSFTSDRYSESFIVLISCEMRRFMAFWSHSRAHLRQLQYIELVPSYFVNISAGDSQLIDIIWDGM